VPSRREPNAYDKESNGLSSERNVEVLCAKQYWQYNCAQLNEAADSKGDERGWHGAQT